ncbi:MAG: TVP38/TMEM64 family protein [Alphaproteobacteria bacterium]|nr:TVP38/TMEM64 family protein [Alphaproteobacteria bacterium]
MSDTMVTDPRPPKAKPLWRRLLPVAVLLGLFAAFFASGLDRFVSLDALQAHRTDLQEFVGAHAVSAVLIYMILYAVMVAASLPGATIFTVTGGLLFGSLLGTVYTVFAATLGATIIFLIARSAFGDALRQKAGGRVERLLDGFRDNAFSYLLVLRLVPLFPFFVVNVAPAFASVPLRIYVFATLIGIVPGTFVYAQVGAGFDSVIASGESLSLAGILTPDVILALVGLAGLSLIPVVYKYFRGRRPTGSGNA